MIGDRVCSLTYIRVQTFQQQSWVATLIEVLPSMLDPRPQHFSLNNSAGGRMIKQ